MQSNNIFRNSIKDELISSTPDDPHSHVNNSSEFTKLSIYCSQLFMQFKMGSTML